MEEEGQIQEPPALGVDGQPPPQETKQEQGSKVQPTKKSNLPSLPTLALGGQFIKQKFRMALLVDVLLKATGDAPIMKKKKWAVEGEKRVGWVADFIRKYLKMDQNDSLFVYVNQSFAPAPDQVVRNLYECFGSDGKLVLHYCRTQAWG